MKRRFIAAASLLLFIPMPALSQTPAKPPQEVVVAPIECWWKTDRSAVRVAETFNMTLTCAVLDTDAMKVVVDESSLSPSALHLVPFEIVGGRRFRDIRNSPRRFFQYSYAMRLLGEDFFGLEVPLPRLQISYRVQNSLSGGSSLAGKEQVYSLRQVPIRVLSLVPKDTLEIRDTPPDTFGDVDSRLFRSNVFLISGGVALALAGLLLAVALVRATMKRRATAATRKLVVPSSVVLRAASQELSAVQTETQQTGWNGDLAGRAAAALRLAGAVALAKPVSQRAIERDAKAGEGQVIVGRGVLGRKIVLSAAVTPGASADRARRNGAAAIWDGISQTLAAFTAVRYSRPSTSSGRPEPVEGRNGTPDGVALDSALAEGQDLVRRLRRQQLMRLGRAKKASISEGAIQTWAR